MIEYLAVRNLFHFYFKKMLFTGGTFSFGDQTNFDTTKFWHCFRALESYMYLTKMCLEILEKLMFLCVGMQLATSIAAGWSLSTTVIMGAISIGILVLIHQARSGNLTQQQKVERADPPEENSVSEDDETRRVRKTPQKSATVSRLYETDLSLNPMVFRHTASNIFDLGLGYKFIVEMMD